MRLIDADALIDALKRHFSDSEATVLTEYSAFWNHKTVLKVIDSSPTVDAVEVVRKQVKGYEGYYDVDQFGRVYSVDRIISVDDNGRVYSKPIKGRQMKQTMHTKGYKVVSLTKDGKTKAHFVHRLVAEAFIDNPNEYPFVNHKDEDKTNNFVDNLEWCTNEYNVNYGNGRIKRIKKIKGRPLTEEHKKKISDGVKRYWKSKTDTFCSCGERRTE